MFRRGPGEGPRLYSFKGGDDGATQYGTLIRDQADNLYGTAFAGGISNPNCAGSQCGTVFELTPKKSDITGTWIWIEHTLYGFGGLTDGGNPVGGVILGPQGYLYGSASWGGSGGGGTVFELTPQPGGSWTLNTLYSFTGARGCGPYGTLVMDEARNLYGTTYCDGASGLGNVFKLTASGMYTSLHDFSGGDGAHPYSNVTIDANGNLYGTTTAGGAGYGVVWKITPAEGSRIVPAESESSECAKTQ